MDIKTLFGLPAHPLLVHVPVVLIPLAFIGALGLWWKPWRDRLGWATAVVLMVAGIFTQLAISSGQTLKHELDSNGPLVRAHVAIAENIRPWLLLFFVFLVAFLWVERRRRLAGQSVSIGTPVLAILFGLTIIFGAVSVYWVQRIGHTGAKAEWQHKMNVAQQKEKTDTGGGGEGGGG
jgi:uncharacterized membrane protein